MRLRWIALPLVLLGFLTSCGHGGGDRGKVSEKEPENLPPIGFAATDDLEAYLRYDEGDSWATREWEAERIAMEETRREEQEKRIAAELAAIAEMELEAREEANQ